MYTITHWTWHAGADHIYWNVDAVITQTGVWRSPYSTIMSLAARVASSCSSKLMTGKCLTKMFVNAPVVRSTERNTHQSKKLVCRNGVNTVFAFATYATSFGPHANRAKYCVVIWARMLPVKRSLATSTHSRWQSRKDIIALTFLVHILPAW